MSSPFLGNPSEAEGSTSLAMAWDMDALRAFSPPGGSSASFFPRPPQLLVITAHTRTIRGYGLCMEREREHGDGKGRGGVLPVIHVSISLT